MVFNRSIVFLSTDTDHHRYLIKKFESKNISFKKIFFETSSIKPAFQTEPFEKKKIKKFEKNFLKNLKKKLN